MQARDPVACAERLAHGPARLGERDQREAVAQRREVREVFGLGDEPRADDAHPYRQAGSRTPYATFSKARPISSTSCSSFSGERSTWIERSSSRSVRGQSGGEPPAREIASS